MGYYLDTAPYAAGRAPGRLWRGLVAVVLALTLFFQGAVSAQAALFSFGIKDEQELGHKFDVLVRSRMPLIEDPEVKGYIQSIVDRLAKTFPPQPFPFQANVLLHNTMNAFAVPGGYVFVHTGLITQMEHESELAGVLAHELAHVTQRHIATRIERSQAITIASIVGALAAALLGGGGQGSGALFAGSVAAGQSAMLNYSRMDETEADQIGLQYLIAAGYAPQGLKTAFEKIRRKQWSSGSNIPEYLSTHPDVGGRINEINARLQSLPADVRNRKDDDTRFNRVKILIWARYGDPEAAARFFADRLAARKNDCLALMGQGILAERRNQIREADAAFSRALECAPNDALIVREAGRFYYNKGDNRAEKMLTKALSLDQNDIMAQFFYARLLDGNGNKAEAHRYYQQVLRKVPQDSEVHYYYGRSLGEAGHVFEAYLHLAYSALYQNEKEKTESWIRKARPNARTPAEQDQLKRFDEVYAERKAVWK